jgi:hypothetical protein
MLSDMISLSAQCPRSRARTRSGFQPKIVVNGRSGRQAAGSGSRHVRSGVDEMKLMALDALAFALGAITPLAIIIWLVLLH